MNRTLHYWMEAVLNWLNENLTSNFGFPIAYYLPMCSRISKMPFVCFSNLSLVWTLCVKICHTHSCKAIDPFWNWIPCQFGAYIPTEMVAVLDDQVISITMVVCWLILHELSNLERIQVCRSHEYWLPKLEAGALPRFNLKDTTCWTVMCSKSIFYSINWTQ